MRIPRKDKDFFYRFYTVKMKSLTLEFCLFLFVIIIQKQRNHISLNLFVSWGIGASDWSKMFRIPAPKHFVESTFLNCYDLTLFIEREVRKKVNKM